MSLFGIANKKKNLDLNLDMPPLPPPGLEEQTFPEIPPSEEDFPSFNEKLNIPKAPSKKTNDLTDIPIPPPPMLDEEDVLKIPQKDDFGFVEPIPMKIMQAKPSMQKRVIEKTLDDKPKFVIMEKFKGIVDEIDLIRSNLKSFEAELIVLDKDEKNEDGLYWRLKNNLNSISKGLRTADKILFEG